MNNVMLLYGGGIDSSALLAFLARQRDQGQIDNLYAVFFRYGQKAEQLEYEAGEYFCDKHSVSLTTIEIPLDSIAANSAILKGGELATHSKINLLDGRNFTFIALAGMLAAKLNVARVAMGFHAEPIDRPFPDASVEFVHAVNRVILLAFVHPFQVTTPFVDWERRDIFEWCKANAPDVLTVAHTCYENVRGGCGLCLHCKTKASILAEIE